jgi:hypothetical protein
LTQALGGSPEEKEREFLPRFFSLEAAAATFLPPFFKHKMIK